MIPRSTRVPSAPLSVGEMSRALLFLLAVTACRSAVEPADRVALDPPNEYRVWWNVTRQCVGRPEADFNRIRWWTATDVLVDELASGLWVRDHDIYLRPEKVDAERVVRHEMIHDLLQSGDHESPFFRTCVGP